MITIPNMLQLSSFFTSGSERETQGLQYTYIAVFTLSIVLGNCFHCHDE